MRFLIAFILLLTAGCLSGLDAHAVSLSIDTLAPVLSNISDERALRLLANEPVYGENWINDMTFPYENVKAVDLPEVTIIPLMGAGENFTITWYGKLSSGYKWRWGRQHHGVDLALKTGDSVFAAWDGVVRYAQWNKSGYGNCVVIRHRNGLETLYAHLSKIQVTPNQYISSGEPIGLGGNTGRSFGAHLHFEVRYKDFSIDPESIVDYNTLKLRTDTLQFIRANIKGSRYGGDVNVVPASSTTDSIAPTADTTLQTSDAHAVITEAPIKKTVSVSEKKKSPTGKSSQKTYVIKKGDTYTSIAKKTGVSIATLKKLNPRQKETKLMPGKTIRIR